MESSVLVVAEAEGEDEDEDDSLTDDSHRLDQRLTKRSSYRSERDARNMRPGLSKDLVFLLLQYLNKEDFKETVHKIEHGSSSYFNMDYFKELVLDGNWEEA